MDEMAKWVERSFAEKPDPGLYPMIVERLAGAPARVEEKLELIPDGLLTRKKGDSWSILEHVGHLGDLEPLWLTRIHEFLAGAGELTAADMTNRKTEEAGHNGRSAAELARSFRTARAGMVAVLDNLRGPDVVRTSLHPRLRRPMRLIDLGLFVAEHDDHHLARIRGIWRGVVDERGPA
jgi:uncharacterized damage-inducible protein DinB